MGKWLTPAFIVIVIVVFIAFYLVMYFGASWAYGAANNNPAASAAVNQTYQSIQQTRTTSTWFSIFTNNFLVSVSLAVPIAGLVLFLVTMWNTGQVIGFLSVAVGINPAQYIQAISFPVAILEIGAYAILGAEITYVSALWITKNHAQDRLYHQTWKSVTLYFILLLAAAAIEAAFI